MKKEKSTETDTETTPVPPPLTVEFDLTKYATYLDEFDLSDDERHELLSTIWMLIQSVVDLGFGVTTPAKTCGQVTHCAPDAVSPEHQTTVDSLKPIIADTLEDTIRILAGKVRQS